MKRESHELIFVIASYDIHGPIDINLVVDGWEFASVADGMFGPPDLG